MTLLEMEGVICWLMKLLEELTEAIAQCMAKLAELVAHGQAAADELDALNLVGG